MNPSLYCIYLYAILFISIYTSPERLDLTPCGLAYQPLLLGSEGRSGGFAYFWRHSHAVHQRIQAGDGVGAVGFEASAGLGLYDDHTLGCESLVTQGQQTGFDVLWQSGGRYVKPQVYGVGHLVHVLASRTLCADGGERHFVFLQGKQRGLHGIKYGPYDYRHSMINGTADFTTFVLGTIVMGLPPRPISLYVVSVTLCSGLTKYEQCW